MLSLITINLDNGDIIFGIQILAFNIERGLIGIAFTKRSLLINILYTNILLY